MSDEMALESLGSRIPRVLKSRLKKVAEGRGMTLEGLVQDMVDDFLMRDDVLEEWDRENRIEREVLEDYRSRRKYAERQTGGQ